MDKVRARLLLIQRPLEFASLKHLLQVRSAPPLVGAPRCPPLGGRQRADGDPRQVHLIIRAAEVQGARHLRRPRQQRQVHGDQLPQAEEGAVPPPCAPAAPATPDPAAALACRGSRQRRRSCLPSASPSRSSPRATSASPCSTCPARGGTATCGSTTTRYACVRANAEPAPEPTLTPTPTPTPKPAPTPSLSLSLHY